MIDWFLCKFLLQGISEPTIVITCGLQNENEKEQKGTYINFILCKLMIPQLIHQWMAIKVNYDLQNIHVFFLIRNLELGILK